MSCKHEHLRLLCSQVVSVRRSGDERSRAKEALLEEIGPCGAAMSMDCPLRKGGEISIECEGCELRGMIVGCQKWIGGYFVQVKFRENEGWVPEKFKPNRLFNPRSMICGRRFCQPDCAKDECLFSSEANRPPYQQDEHSQPASGGFLSRGQSPTM